MVLLESLAAIGCLFLFWTVFGTLLRPKAAFGAVLVLPVVQDTTGLEQSMRWVRFLRKTGLFTGEVLILEKEDCIRLDSLLYLFQNEVQVLSVSEISAYFTHDGA